MNVLGAVKRMTQGIAMRREDWAPRWYAVVEGDEPIVFMDVGEDGYPVEGGLDSRDILAVDWVVFK